MTDFSHLKTWLDHPNPRPVVLECQVSRSGLSMSVYERDRLFCRVNGCGFDRYGCALAEFLERLYMPELGTLARNCRPIENGPEPTHYQLHWSRTKDFYGLAWDRNFKVSLEGASGIESMCAVADAIGLSVQVHETRSSTLLIIQKKG